MNTKWLKLLFLAGAMGTLLLNNSCESASTAPVAIPGFVLSCSISGCDGSVMGQGFVFLMKSNCPDPGDSSFEPTASGNTVLSCGSGGCSGTVSSWSDPNGDPINEIMSGNYQVCAYVDKNGNLAEESGEPEHESSQSILSATGDSGPVFITLDDWELVP